MREALALAIAGHQLTGQAQPLPFDYVLWLTGIRMGVPAWVLEGHPADKPPIEWVIRSLEFARMEQAVTVSRR